MIVSGDFNKGIPLGKVTMFAGESGAAKSYIASGNIIKHAQEQGIFTILIDSENALDQSWLHALGVDTSEEKMMKLNMAHIDDVGKTISEFIKEYRSQFSDVPEDERQRILIVIDSLGMLLTPTEVEQFEKGEMKGDMGIKAKRLKALIVNCVNIIGDLDVGIVVTNHTYASQDMFDPDDKISGGQGMVYASSIVVAMKKLKLKEDAEGNKITNVRGIRAACKIMKTRYNKPFETVQVKIPYDGGMDPYSGLLDYFESKDLVKKSGNKLVYVDSEGNEHKHFRKQWDKNHEGVLDLIMGEYNPDKFDRDIDDDDDDDSVIDDSDNSGDRQILIEETDDSGKKDD